MKLAVKNSLSASLGAVFAISIVFSCSSQQIIAARAVSVRPLFVETSLARATLQCAVLTETDIFTPENGKERAFSECIAQKDTFFNERIRAVPQYAPPPAILQMPPDSIKKAGQYSPHNESVRLSENEGVF
jgi:hypothetical protein